MMENDGYITNVINALFLRSSMCEIPSLYTAFDQQFMSYVVTVADVVLVAKCYETV